MERQDDRYHVHIRWIHQFLAALFMCNLSPYVINTLDCILSL